MASEQDKRPMAQDVRAEGASRSEDLAWTDSDGDSVVFSASRDAIGSESVLASIEILSDGFESGVYIDEEDARRLIAWLSRRLNGALGQSFSGPGEATG